MKNTKRKFKVGDILRVIELDNSYDKYACIEIGDEVEVVNVWEHKGEEGLFGVDIVLVDYELEFTEEGWENEDGSWQMLESQLDFI